MIGIIAKNNLTRQTLSAMLKEFNPVVYQSSDGGVDALVMYQTQSFVDGFFKTSVPFPVLLIGAMHEEADICLPAPCRVETLISALRQILEIAQNAPVFENALFAFDGKTRTLRHKQTEEVFHLTEKENALITYLAQHLERVCTKEELLTNVWKYNPEVESHTVESHIYALKQKIGLDAQLFLQNDEGGYFLITDAFMERHFNPE